MGLVGKLLQRRLLIDAAIKFEETNVRCRLKTLDENSADAIGRLPRRCWYGMDNHCP